MIAKARWQRVALVALVLYPAVMIVIATANGPGISVDSVSYAAAATSFADTGRFVTYDGTDLTLFPPGLPAALGLLVAMGFSLSTAAIVVNVVAVCLTIIASYLLARQVLVSPGWSLVVAAAVSLLAATVRVGSYLWTEALFTALIAGALVLIAWAVRRHRTPWWLVVAAGALVALSTTLRYVGVVAVPVVMVAIAWASRESRVRRALVAGSIGLMGLVLPAFRNVMLGSSALGERYPGSMGIEGAVTGLVLQWGEYVAPSRSTSLTVIVGAVVGIVLLVGMWLVIVQRNRPGAVLALFVVLYWTAIVFSQVGTRLDVVTERFAAPVLAPSVVLVLVALRSGLAESSRQLAPVVKVNQEKVHRVLAGGLGVLGVAVLGLSVVHSVEFVRDGNRGGIDLASVAAADRFLVQAATALPAGAIVASNDPWQVWWSRGGVVLNFPPSAEEWPSERVESDLDAVERSVDARERIFVVIDEEARASLHLSELEQVGLSVRVLESAKGVLVADVSRN